jgi:hypothetical protein
VCAARIMSLPQFCEHVIKKLWKKNDSPIHLHRSHRQSIGRGAKPKVSFFALGLLAFGLWLLAFGFRGAYRRGSWIGWRRALPQGKVSSENESEQ